jgi:hypothetical protein
MKNFSIAKKLQREKVVSWVCMVIGGLTALGSLWAGFEVAMARQHMSAHGTWSAGEVALMQQQIEELPPSKENLQKLAIGVRRRATSDAERIQSLMANYALLWFELAAAGVFVVGLSLQLRRLVGVFQGHVAGGEAEGDDKRLREPGASGGGSAAERT